MKTAIVRSTYNLKSVETYEGETIETKVARIVQEKAPITDGAPIIYTDREQGVLPAYNVRTDRWDIAENAMDKVNAAKWPNVTTISVKTYQIKPKEVHQAKTKKGG